MEGVTLNGKPLHWPVDDGVEAPQEYCYVCRRCTDHVGEHDGAVLAGLVDYEDHGVTVWTPRADRLMGRMGRPAVRLLAANLDEMESAAWERRGHVWMVTADGGYLVDRVTGQKVEG